MVTAAGLYTFSNNLKNQESKYDYEKVVKAIERSEDIEKLKKGMIKLARRDQKHNKERIEWYKDTAMYPLAIMLLSITNFIILYRLRKGLISNKRL